MCVKAHSPKAISAPTRVVRMVVDHKFICCVLRGLNREGFWDFGWLSKTLFCYSKRPADQLLTVFDQDSLFQ